MFQVNSNKTVNVIVADDGGFVINYYEEIKPPEVPQMPSNMPPHMRNMQPPSSRFLMKTIVATTVEDVAEKVKQLCQKIQEAI